VTKSLEYHKSLKPTGNIKRKKKMCERRSKSYCNDGLAMEWQRATWFKHQNGKKIAKMKICSTVNRNKNSLSETAISHLDSFLLDTTGIQPPKLATSSSCGKVPLWRVNMPRVPFITAILMTSSTGDTSERITL